jgi:hypothetical protein
MFQQWMAGRSMLNSPTIYKLRQQMCESNPGNEQRREVPTDLKKLAPLQNS